MAISVLDPAVGVHPEELGISVLDPVAEGPSDMSGHCLSGSGTSSFPTLLS
ncbi:hypothetical protein ETB97_012791 [Aspergillus alliaceus]|uniref:Uncharacterized protein n=1 Tax=Petromyces alliaceus TaxID=209559 RepID=A0A8H6A6T2_PETAA|nr:hypothetical protein ETB97_012791 [Aspergillus burnettii]